MNASGAASDSPHIICVVSGELRKTDGSVLAMSVNAVLLAGGSFAFTATRPGVVLVTDRFA